MVGITDDYQELLKSKGYRLTPQRQLVLEMVKSSSDHISAEEILASLRPRFPAISDSTVYRTLELLREMGLVTETVLRDGRKRYHAIEKGQHHHLVCEGCGRVFDLNEALLQPLRDALRERYSFRANLTHFAIFGLCAECGG